MENSKNLKLGSIKDRKTRNQQERIEKIKQLLKKIIIQYLLYANDQIEIPYQYQNNIDQFIQDTVDKKLIQVDIYLDKIQRFNQEKKQFKIQQSSKIKIKKEEKPQDVYFKDKIDNSVEIPFIPKITIKHCQKYPLDKNLKIAQQNPQNFFNFIDNPQEYNFENPYKKEIEEVKPIDLNLLKNLLPSLYKKEKVMGSNFEFISDINQLKKLINHLESQIIFAVDLEHHNVRSFQGFTCLMQITTKQKDYIIDTILLRNELQELNRVFTNENIIKLFHGSQSDMQWLQKDFGIYTVNLFDTYILAKTFRRNNSLANYLSEFCQITSDKSNQITDWRIRPLKLEQLEYARMDTHYLFQVLEGLLNQFYDFFEQQKQMNSDFKDYNNINDYFQKIFQDMQKLALDVYRKPKLYSNGFKRIYAQKKQQENWTEQQLQKFQCIWEWRNLRARKFDDSENFIFKTKDLLNLCERQITEQYLQKLESKKYLNSQHFHKFKDFLYQNNYVQQDHEKASQFVHKVNTMKIEQDQKQDQENIILEKLKKIKLRNINQQHKFEIDFNIDDQKQIYEHKKTDQAIQILQNQQLQNLLDYSEFQNEIQDKQEIKNEIKDQSQSMSDTEQVIMLDNDQNNYKNQNAINGMDLLKNLEQLNISNGIKKNLISNFYDNQNPKNKKQQKEVQPDQVQQEIESIQKQIKNNNNIKFDKGLFKNSKKKPIRDKSKKLRKKKQGNQKSFF